MKAAGARRVTMQDVARLASVSTKTVSNVLNGHPKATEETRKRVLEAVDLLGYRINVAARNLRQGKTGQISLALPELKNPYFAELADLVLEEADEPLAQLLTEAGLARFHAYCTEHPPQSVLQRRRIVTAFLEKFGRPDQLATEIKAPGWTEDLVGHLTQSYLADVGRIAEMPGVTLIEP